MSSTITRGINPIQPKSFTWYGSGGRSLNTGFTISSTRDAFVAYTLSTTSSITLSGGTTSTGTLQTSPDGVTWTSTNQASSGFSGTVLVGVAITSTQSGVVCGIVPAGYQARILTAGTAPTFLMGQEVLL